MTTLTDTVADIQERVLDAITTAQTPVLDAVRTTVATVEGYLPDDRPEVPFADQIVSLDEIVELGFGFAEKLLTNQHEFAMSLVDAVRPLLPQTVTPPKAAPKAA